VTTTLTKPPKSARKAKGDGHLRRAEILGAAERIFIRDGYQGATIRKIAEEVGVSSTALYMHFRDKDEILLEICEGAISTLLASNSEISGRPIDSVSRVRMMLDAYMRFGLENPNTYRLAFCSAPAEFAAQRREVTEDLGVRCYERFMSVVAEIAAEGRLRLGDADDAAFTLWAACHGLVSLAIGQKNPARGNQAKLMALMLDSLFQGLVID
jgi:AcrR family transcriptional regulator